jgi:DNA-binding MarR family transcriptional regulator
MNMLVTLAEFGICAPRKIGEFLQLERSTVSRNLDHLMRKNLVEAISSDAKGIREISITTDGSAKIQDILPDWRKAQKEAAQLLGQGGVSAMHEAADSIWSTL